MAVKQARSPLDAAIDALVEGRNRDPFSLLGPHVDEDGSPVVRTFQPAARSVELRLVATGALLRMAKRHSAGLYEVRLKPPSGGAQGGPEALEGPDTTTATATTATGTATAPATDSRPDYRIRITFSPDHVIEIDDPYRYGRVLTGFDPHLFGEGTHHRMFDKLWSHVIASGGTKGVHFAV